jgi:hypothetical protein
MTFKKLTAQVQKKPKTFAGLLPENGQVSG